MTHRLGRRICDPHLLPRFFVCPLGVPLCPLAVPLCPDDFVSKNRTAGIAENGAVNSTEHENVLLT